jgi:hypothetical protein
MTGGDKAGFAVNLRREEGNLLISALAECPFKLVYELIGRLNQQANAKAAQRSDGSDDNAGDDNDDDAAQEFLLTAAELKLAITALGNLPFTRVHALIQNMQAQIQTGRVRAASATDIKRKRA